MRILRWAVVEHLKFSTSPLVVAQTFTALCTITIKTPRSLPTVFSTTGTDSQNHHSIRINSAAKSADRSGGPTSEKAARCSATYRRPSSSLTTKDCACRKQLRQRARFLRRQQDRASLPTSTTAVIRASLTFSEARIEHQSSHLESYSCRYAGSREQQSDRRSTQHDRLHIQSASRREDKSAHDAYRLRSQSIEKHQLCLASLD